MFHVLREHEIMMDFKLYVVLPLYQRLRLDHVLLKLTSHHISVYVFIVFLKQIRRVYVLNDLEPKENSTRKISGHQRKRDSGLLTWVEATSNLGDGHRCASKFVRERSRCQSSVCNECITQNVIWNL